MVDPNVEATKVASEDPTEVREGQGARQPALALADTLAAGLSEFFTRRRQNRAGLHAPLVPLERGE